MTTYRILVTGSRDWKSRQRIKTALSEYVQMCLDHKIWPLVLVHGSCYVNEDGSQKYTPARGADAMADSIWLELRAEHGDKLLPAERHPADWHRFGGMAGPMRNSEMVNSKPHICLAFVDMKSVGTRDCMRKAEAAGVLVLTYKSTEKVSADE